MCRQKGSKLSDEHKRKIALANTGKKRTKEMIKRLSDSHKGYKYPKGRKGNMFNKKHTDETKRKMSLSSKKNIKNGNHNFWKGGISKLNIKIRNTFENKIWRISVFERDKYTCINCHQIGGDLQAHHIKAFSLILKENNIKTIKQALNCKELWNINNGVTLCKKCHRLTDNFGSKSHNFG